MAPSADSGALVTSEVEVAEGMVGIGDQRNRRVARVLDSA
jgi:hypothetical protein